MERMDTSRQVEVFKKAIKALDFIEQVKAKGAQLVVVYPDDVYPPEKVVFI